MPIRIMFVRAGAYPVAGSRDALNDPGYMLRCARRWRKPSASSIPILNAICAAIFRPPGSSCSSAHSRRMRRSPC